MSEENPCSIIFKLFHEHYQFNKECGIPLELTFAKFSQSEYGKDVYEM